MVEGSPQPSADAIRAVAVARNVANVGVTSSVQVASVGHGVAVRSEDVWAASGLAGEDVGRGERVNLQGQASASRHEGFKQEEVEEGRCDIFVASESEAIEDFLCVDLDDAGAKEAEVQEKNLLGQLDVLNTIISKIQDSQKPNGTVQPISQNQIAVNGNGTPYQHSDAQPTSTSANPVRFVFEACLFDVSGRNRRFFHPLGVAGC